MQLTKPQKYLGGNSLLACMLAIDFVVIFAIDVYLPALPSMQKFFGVTVSYLNLTLFVFLLVSAIAVLIMGPLSDRTGRKKALLGSCVLFFLGSFGCMLSNTIEQLILFRMIQAIGMGGVVALETAMIKDVYAGDDLDKAMTIFQSLAIIGPALAPFIGSFLVDSFDWRAVFIFLTIAGVISIILACLISETCTIDTTKRSFVKKMWGDSKTLWKNKSFLSLCVILGLVGIPYFGLLAVISYVCLNFFTISYLEFSIIYATICIASVLAPYIYMKAIKTVSANSILKACMVLWGISGIGLVAVGAASPLIFTLICLPYIFAEGIVRPLAYVDLLNQPEELVGTASSLSNFFYSFATAFATIFATFEFWPDYILGVGVIAIICLTVSLFFLRAKISHEE